MAETIHRVEYNVALIPQCRGDTCWYAAAQMIVRWARSGNRPVDTELFTPNPKGGGFIDTAEANELACDPAKTWELGTEDAETIKKFAEEANLRWTVVKNFTRARIALLLSAHGPLWYSGKFEGAPADAQGHAVVITAIRHNTLAINDPLDKGSRLYPPFDAFFEALQGQPGVPLLHYY
jgi:hypothetical protein